MRAHGARQLFPSGAQNLLIEWLLIKPVALLMQESADSHLDMAIYIMITTVTDPSDHYWRLPILLHALWTFFVCLTAPKMSFYESVRVVVLKNDASIGSAKEKWCTELTELFTKLSSESVYENILSCLFKERNKEKHSRVKKDARDNWQVRTAAIRMFQNDKKPTS